MPSNAFQKTLFVAASLCLVCSIFVSSAAVVLRPKQVENKLKDKQKNILEAAGLPIDNIEESFSKIESVVIELETGEIREDMDASTFDQRKAAKEPTTQRLLSREEDFSGIKQISKFAPVYLLKNDNKKLVKLVLPIKGKGLWSTLYGFISLGSDLNTVEGIAFYEHGETPGLGGEIDNTKWKSSWVGKELFSEGRVALKVLKGRVVEGNPLEKYQIDGLSGATITSQGVSYTIQFWLGENGFGPYLKKLRSAVVEQGGSTNGES